MQGLLSKRNTAASQVIPFAITASWQNENYTQLKKLLNRCNSDSFETTLGRILSCLCEDDHSGTHELLKKVRSFLTQKLTGASIESYQRAYDISVRLSMLHDIKSFCDVWHSPESEISQKLQTLIGIWNTKLPILVPSIRIREPILLLRYELLRLLEDKKGKHLNISDKLSSYKGEILLSIAKECRKTGHFHLAYKVALRAINSNVPFSFVEKAKIAWAQDLQSEAIQELRADILSDEKDNGVDIFLLRKKKLLLVRWLENSDALSSSMIIAFFLNLIKDQDEWEKGHFFLGKYYNRLYEKEKEKLKHNKSLNVSQLLHLGQLVCKEFSKSLVNGSKYLYESLPRLLTIWMDAASTVVQIKSKNSSLPEDDERIAKFHHISKLVQKLSSTIPTYQLLTAIPQLISRISHTHQTVKNILEFMISNVMIVYPQQTIWHLMAVLKSTISNRSQRASAVLSRVKVY